MPIKKCLQCGKRYEIINAVINRSKFCSRACHAKHTFTGMKRPKRSEEYRRKLGLAHIGKEPPNKKPSVILTCQICNNDFEVPQRRAESAKYCSRECSHESKRRVTGTAHPLWTRIKRNCEWCGKEVWVKPAKLFEFRFCSRQCTGASIAKMLAERNGPTSIEKILDAELNRRNINHLAQHKIANWIVDFAIPEWRIAIEADGDYWHSSSTQKEKDHNKDHWLSVHKWYMFRFTETSINQSVSDCVDQIEDFIIKQQAE